MNKTLTKAPILEWDSDDSNESKQHFFENNKKPFHVFKKAIEQGVHSALIFFPRDFKKLTEITVHCKKLYDFKAASAISPVYLYKNKFLIALCPLGGPSAANLMEELAYVGIDTFLACGTSGCLLDEYPKSKYFLPTVAIRDEGLSYHYLPASRTVETCKDFNNIIRKTLTAQKQSFIEGIVWTTDAMYRETPNRINRRIAEGAIGVDMECASLAACAQYNKLKFASLFYFTDLIQEETWQWKIYDKVTLRTELVLTCEKILDNMK